MFLRRSLSLVITFLMCVFLVVFVSADNIYDNQFTVSSVSGHALETVAVEVSIDNRTGYANLEFALEFDKEKLEVVTAGGKGTVTMPAQANANGRVKIAYAGVANAEESGTILTVEFRIKANAPIGDIPIALKAQRGVHYYYSGADGRDMNFYEPVVTNGKVTVLDNGWPVGIDLNIAEGSKLEYGRVPVIQFNDKVPAGASASFTFRKWDGTAYVDAGSTPPTEIGKYEVTARLELDGYDPFPPIVCKYEITAVRTDAELLLDGAGVGAEGKQIVFNGSNHRFELSNITWTVPVYSYSTDGGTTWVAGNSIRNAGTYTVKAAAEAENYDSVEITRTVVIRKAEVTVEPVVRDKVYDGTVTADIVGRIADALPGNVDIRLKAPASVDFADANAGTKKAVRYNTSGGFTLEGADAANYSLVNAKPEAFGSITPLEITVTPVAVQKLSTTETDPVIAYTYTPKLIGTDKFTGALTREKADSNEKGVYNILKGSLALSDNYVIKFTEGVKFTILDRVYTRIEIAAQPAKTEYIVGQSFAADGLKLRAYYRDIDGTECADLIETGYTWTPEVFTAVGDKIPVTVTYSGLKAVVEVKVAAKKVISIEITDYAESAIDGDTGASVIRTVRAVYNNGETDNDFKGYQVSPAELKLDDKTEEKTINVAVEYRNEGDTAFMLDFADVKVLPREARNETTGKNYRYFTEAVAEAAGGDVISVMNDVVIARELRIEKSITVKIVGNNTLRTAENVTIATAKRVKLTFDTSTAESDLEISVNGKDIVVEAGTAGYVVKSDDVGSVARQISNAYKYIDRFYRDIVIDKTENGKIEGHLKVKVGESAKFTITADAGYEIEDVIVDGESVGAVGEYIFDDVRAPHTISAVFREKAE